MTRTVVPLPTTSPTDVVQSTPSDLPVLESVKEDVDAGVKRSLETHLDDEDLPILERIDKRIRFAEETKPEQSPAAPLQTGTVPSEKGYGSDNGESEKQIRLDSDNDEKAKSTVVPIVETPPPPMETSDTKNDAKKPVEALPIETPPAPAKKRIFLRRARTKRMKKRSAPCKRANQRSQAAWVGKYNIEECWVRLDLYDVTCVMGKD